MSESKVFQWLSLASAMMCSETGSIPPQLSSFMNKHGSGISTCANCGKGEGDESGETLKLKPCDGACKMVKYIAVEIVRLHTDHNIRRNA